MKVVHLSTVHSIADSRIMEKEASALVDAGWTVVVVLPHDKDEIQHGVRIVGVDKPSNRLTRATVTAVKVALKGLKERGDVYHFHDPELLPIGLALRTLGKTVVYDVHETHSATIAHRPYLPKWLRRPLAHIVKNLELVAARQFSGIVAATPAIEEQFRNIKTARVVVQNFPLLDGTDWNSRVRERNRRPVAVYMGAMSVGRGAITMVQAMGFVRSDLGVRLTLAGSITSELLEKLRAQPGFERVNVAGRLSRPQLNEILAEASVGMVVLHPEPNYVSSFPTKMFEYMVAGLPVIASDFPLWRSIVLSNRCGLVVDPLNPSEIAQAIEYLISHEAEAREMGQRGSDLVRREYNWSTEREKLIAFYRRFNRN